MFQSKKSYPRSVTAVFTAVSLLLTQVAFAAPAFSASTPEVSLPDSVRLNQALGLHVPSSIGTVEKLQAGSGKSIFHIQTAHGHYQAQQNINFLLKDLEKNYGVKTILVEGASESLDPEIINFFPKDHKSTMSVVDTLTRKAVIQGPEIFLLESNSAKGFGIEDPKAYEKNLQDFASVLRARNESKQFLDNLDSGIERLAAVYLDTNLRSFLKQMDRRETGIVPFDAYLQQLRIAAQKYVNVDLADASFQLLWPQLVRLFTIEKLEKKIDAAQFPKEKTAFLKAIQPYTGKGSVPMVSMYDEIKNLLDLKDLSVHLPDPETSALFEKLVQTLPSNFNYAKFSSVTAFCGLLILKSEIRAEQLSEEISRMEDKITDKLATKKSAKELVAILKDYRMLQKLFALELLPADFDRISNSVIPAKAGIQPSNIAARLQELAIDPTSARGLSLATKSTGTDPHALSSARFQRPQSTYAVQDIQPRRLRGVEFKNIEKLDALYARAVRFYEGARERDSKMLARIEERLNETGADKVAVITGGFHSEPFAKYFETRGYNYALVTPKITTVDAQGRDDYLNIMLGFASKMKSESSQKSPETSSIANPLVTEVKSSPAGSSLILNVSVQFLSPAAFHGVEAHVLAQTAATTTIILGNEGSVLARAGTGTNAPSVAAPEPARKRSESRLSETQIEQAFPEADALHQALLGLPADSLAAAIQDDDDEVRLENPVAQVLALIDARQPIADVSDIADYIAKTRHVESAEIAQLMNAYNASLSRSEARSVTPGQIERGVKIFLRELLASGVSRKVRLSRPGDLSGRAVARWSREEELRLAIKGAEATASGVVVFSTAAAGASSRQAITDVPPETETMIAEVHGEGHVLQGKSAVPLGRVDGKPYTYLGLMFRNIQLLGAEIKRLFPSALPSKVLIMINPNYQAELDKELARQENYGLDLAQFINQKGRVGFQQDLAPKYYLNHEDVMNVYQLILDKNVDPNDPESRTKLEAKYAQALANSLAKADEVAQAIAEGRLDAVVHPTEQDPAGHAEFFHQMVSKAVLLDLIDQGIEYIPFRNIDNAAATYDEKFLAILGYMIEQGFDALYEVSSRGKGMKGGAWMIDENGNNLIVEDPSIDATWKQIVKKLSGEGWTRKVELVDDKDKKYEKVPADGIARLEAMLKEKGVIEIEPTRLSFEKEQITSIEQLYDLLRSSKLDDDSRIAFFSNKKGEIKLVRKVTSADAPAINNAAAVFTPKYISGIYRKPGQSFQDFVQEMREARANGTLEQLAERGRSSMPLLLDPKPSRDTSVIGLINAEGNMHEATAVPDDIKIGMVITSSVRDLDMAAFEKMSLSEKVIYFRGLAFKFLATKQWKGPAESYAANLVFYPVIMQMILKEPLLSRELETILNQSRTEADRNEAALSKVRFQEERFDQATIQPLTGDVALFQSELVEFLRANFVQSGEIVSGLKDNVSIRGVNGLRVSVFLPAVQGRSFFPVRVSLNGSDVVEGKLSRLAGTEPGRSESRNNPLHVLALAALIVGNFFTAPQTQAADLPTISYAVSDDRKTTYIFGGVPEGIKNTNGEPVSNWYVEQTAALATVWTNISGAIRPGQGYFLRISTGPTPVGITRLRGETGVAALAARDAGTIIPSAVTAFQTSGTNVIVTLSGSFPKGGSFSVLTSSGEVPPQNVIVNPNGTLQVTVLNRATGFVVKQRSEARTEPLYVTDKRGDVTYTATQLDREHSLADVLTRAFGANFENLPEAFGKVDSFQIQINSGEIFNLVITNISHSILTITTAEIQNRIYDELAGLANGFQSHGLTAVSPGNKFNKGLVASDLQTISIIAVHRSAEPHQKDMRHDLGIQASPEALAHLQKLLERDRALSPRRSEARKTEVAVLADDVIQIGKNQIKVVTLRLDGQAGERFVELQVVGMNETLPRLVVGAQVDLGFATLKLKKPNTETLAVLTVTSVDEPKILRRSESRDRKTWLPGAATATVPKKAPGVVAPPLRLPPRSEGRALNEVQVTDFLKRFTFGIISRKDAESLLKGVADEVLLRAAKKVLGKEIILPGEQPVATSYLEAILGEAALAPIHFGTGPANYFSRANTASINQMKPVMVTATGLRHLAQNNSRAAVALIQQMAAHADAGDTGAKIVVAMGDADKVELFDLLIEKLANRQSGFSGTGPDLKGLIVKVLDFRNAEELATFLESAKGKFAKLDLGVANDSVSLSGIKTGFLFEVMGEKGKALAGNDLWAVAVVGALLPRAIATVEGLDAQSAAEKLLEFFNGQNNMGLKVQGGVFSFSAIQTLLQAIIAAKYIEVMA